MGTFAQIIQRYAGQPVPAKGTLLSGGPATPAVPGLFQKMGQMPIQQRDPRAVDAALQKGNSALMGIALPAGLSAIGGPVGMSVGNSLMGLFEGIGNQFTPQQPGLLAGKVIPRAIPPEEVRVPVWSGKQSLFPKPYSATDPDPGNLEFPSSFGSDPRFSSGSGGPVSIATSGKHGDLTYYDSLPNNPGTPQDRFPKR